MPRRGENIRKRKDGRWEGRYCTREPGTGKSIPHSVYAKSYGEVKQKLYKAKMGKERMEEKASAKISFNIVAEEWLNFVRNERKQATYTKYRLIYEKYLYPKVGNLLFSEWNSKLLADLYLNSSGEFLSDSLQKSISCVLNQIASYASTHYALNAVHGPAPKHRSIRKPVEVLSFSEQTRLLQYLYTEMDIYKLGIILCISTGVRLGELCALKWEDIDFEENLLNINATVQRITVEGYNTKTTLLEGPPKSSFSRREIPISGELTRLLLSYHRKHEKYLFEGRKPVEPRTYQYKFQRYLQSAGIKKRNFHILRHTFATNCIHNGIDIKSLSDILGHSDVKITLNRYVHPTIEDKRRHMNTLFAVYGQLVGQKMYDHYLYQA